jgi:hypothetical protein
MLWCFILYKCFSECLKLSRLSSPYLDFIFLSTLGVPRNDMRAGQNFCHKKVVKWELSLTRSDRLDMRVSRQSRKNIAKGFCFGTLEQTLSHYVLITFYTRRYRWVGWEGSLASYGCNAHSKMFLYHNMYNIYKPSTWITISIVPKSVQ